MGRHSAPADDDEDVPDPGVVFDDTATTGRHGRVLDLPSALTQSIPIVDAEIAADADALIAPVVDIPAAEYAPILPGEAVVPPEPAADLDALDALLADADESEEPGAEEPGATEPSEPGPPRPAGARPAGPAPRPRSAQPADAAAPVPPAPSPPAPSPATTTPAITSPATTTPATTSSTTPDGATDELPAVVDGPVDHPEPVAGVGDGDGEAVTKPRPAPRRTKAEKDAARDDAREARLAARAAKADAKAEAKQARKASEPEPSEHEPAAPEPSAPEPAAPEPSAPEPATAAAPPKQKHEHATAADVALLRSDRALLSRCLAGLLVPFVIYAVVMLVVGGHGVQWVLWIWIPTIVGGVVAGSFLDVAHKKAAEPARDVPLSGS